MDTYLQSDVLDGRLPTFVNETDLGISHSATGIGASFVNGTTGQGYVPSDADKLRILVIAVLLALTVIGNLILIAAIVSKRSRRRKRVNILLMNLAFGDLGVALFVNTTEILFLSFGDWALGEVICKMSVYAQMVCLSSATNLLTAMSIDRYQVIVKPMQTLARRPRIRLKIIVAWVLSLVVAVPQLFIFVQYDKGFKQDNSPVRVCGSKGYTAAWQRKLNFTFTAIYILVVPMVIMLYCYSKIIQVVWIRAKPETNRVSLHPVCKSNLNFYSKPSAIDNRCSGDQNSSNSAENRNEYSCMCGENEKLKTPRSVKWVGSVKDGQDGRAEVAVQRSTVQDEDCSSSGSPRMSVRRNLVTASKRRVLIMTLMVVVSFLVCQTPYILVSLVRIYSDYQLQLERVVFITEVLVMVHSTLNPILYGVFTLRQYHLKYLVSFVSSSRQQPPSNHPTQQESNKLLQNPRANLNGRWVTTTATRTTCKKHPHSSLLTHTNTQPTKNYPRGSLSGASILYNHRPIIQPCLNRFRKRKSHNSDAILFANMDAIRLDNQKECRQPVTSQTDTITSPSCTLFTNSHIFNPSVSIST